MVAYKLCAFRRKNPKELNNRNDLWKYNIQELPEPIVVLD